MSDKAEWYPSAIPYPYAVSFQAVFGINQGYFHGNQQKATPIEVVAPIWQIAMDQERAESGIVVTGVITAGKVVYPQEFGCPPYGEDVAIVTGHMVDKFMPGRSMMEYRTNSEKYRDAVARVVRTAKVALGQERVQVSFTKMHQLLYLVPNEEG